MPRSSKVRAASSQDASLVAIERAMVRLRRSFTRRAISRRVEREQGEPVAASRAFVADALDQGPSEEGGVTVGEVAERLGIDPSRASRMVSEAIEAGDVVRVASQRDGRRSCLELTPQGRALAEAAGQHRRHFFVAVMEDWPAEERKQFARLLERFVTSLDRVSAGSRDEE
ncbi:MarR family winged helix-turn-helix transcriptional regulator [Stigmatella erecta]|uniref:MarR family winged helix-turn-helix transcriptional regulator n=1 Tax=Stigmatella erecta TaxID=83460 RepID=UPI001FEBCEC6|nr:MarR family winged helix-turn-helix transcriptional regulator [Stigmatella erecta]